LSRWTLPSLVGALLVATMVVIGMSPPSAEASHLPGKSIVLLGSLGRSLGETPWDMLRQQLASRGFPESDIVEFQYAGGGFGLDGVFSPAAGGACESFSKASFLALQQTMAGLKQARPDNEVFLVGQGVGGFLATQALFGAAFGQVPDPDAWTNLSGIAAISAPTAGLSTQRGVFLHAQGAQQGCADQSMITWMEEIGQAPDPPGRYAIAEDLGAKATALGYKIGTFGNTVDCEYRYGGPGVCPKLTEAAGDKAALLLLLGDERQTMFIKTGTMWKEYNEGGTAPGDLGDNHSALLLKPVPMADVAEFVMSQTR
jgi:hypothetical protein